MLELIFVGCVSLYIVAALDHMKSLKERYHG